MIIRKSIHILLVGLLVLIATACNEYEEDAFSFDNNAPQYVELDVSPVTTIEADSFDTTPYSIDVLLRVARPEITTVTYQVTGDISEAGSIEIPVRSLSGSATLQIPAADNGTATIELVSVDGGLTIGRDADGDSPDLTSAVVNWTY